MFCTQRHDDGGIRLQHLAKVAGGLAVTGALIVGLAAAASAVPQSATSRPHLFTAASAEQPSIASVSFTGTAGGGVASPTITMTGSHFGARPPSGTSDNSTSCGPYTANGEVYGRKLYFVDDRNFIAGYSTRSGGAACIGMIVKSWSPGRVVLQFGNAYGTFDHWYLSDGDGYAISVRHGIYGGTVKGLS
jgi:hypothetical protein